MGVIGHELDIDKLLWVPGKKTIFLPSSSPLSYSSIVAAEWERMVPRIRTIFEMDNAFYKVFKEGGGTRISSREFTVPLIFEPEQLRLEWDDERRTT